MATPINVLPPPSVPAGSNVQYLPTSEKVTPLVGKGIVKTQQSQKSKIQQRKVEEKTSLASLIRNIDPSNYRNTFFHNTCTAILTEGYHCSFSQLFNLVQQQREEHKQAGPGAIMLSPLIDNREDILDYLQVRLTGAEEAHRRGDMDMVYMSQRDLALHFEQTGDHWLADHFHGCCLETSKSIVGDNRRKEGEAHLHVGLAYENRGELEKAAEHMEVFHELTSTNSWHTDNGESLYPISCEHLRRVYTTIAEKSSNDTSVHIDYLERAHTMSKKAKDTYQEGLASHRLGCAHEKNNDYDTAIQYHKSFLERSRYHGDKVGVGNAYEALARCHEHKGDLESAVKCLELYVEVAEKSEDIRSLANSCKAAGTIFNTLGDYGKTLEYFSKCYTYCQQLNDSEAIQSAQVQYGIALTHYRMEQFTSAIDNISDSGVMSMVHWKGKRIMPGEEREEEREEEEREEEKESGRYDIVQDDLMEEEEEKDETNTSNDDTDTIIL